MSTIMTTSLRNASAVMQHLLAVALIVFTSFLIPAHATDLSLGYDANGNVNSKTTPSGTTTFNYDALDRIQTESGPEGARTHVYDPNGNRTSDTAGTTTAYTPNTDKLQTINGITVTLDASGNLTRDGTYIYVWNALNQLAELHKADNTLVASYFYDYQNRRSRKVTTAAAPQGATTAYYTYDEQSHLIAETGPNNQPIATYIWNGDILTGFITYQPTRTVYTVQVDQLGSPFQVRTLAGTVVWRWESEAFGKTAPNDDVDGDGTMLTLNLRFPGQYYDQESGLHYNLNRYYSPKLARYLTPDPIGLAGGANVYGYVGGNPVGYSDPFGLEVFLCSQPAFGGGPVDHQWIKTDTVEAGMGGTRGNIPGNQSGDRPYDPVQVTDHSGRSKEAGSSCKKVDNVDEQKVNDLLKIGRPLGLWSANNQCQSFARQTLNEASTVAASLPKLPRHPLFQKTW